MGKIGYWRSETIRGKVKDYTKGIYKLCMKSYKTMKTVGAWNKNKLLSATEIWNNNEQNRKRCFWNNVYMKITVAKMRMYIDRKNRCKGSN